MRSKTVISVRKMEYDKKKLIPVNLIYWKSTNRPFPSYILPLLKATPSVTLSRC